jgi:hypothetical protein
LADPRHVYEFLGSTKITEGHNHRFAGVTSQAIVLSNGRHRHRFSTNVDFYEDHHHAIRGITGIDIPIRNR